MPIHNLVRGVHHFRSSVFSSHRELFTSLAERQQPEVLFITCSDSRIVPSLLTQTDAGDLFIMRNAGNIVPAYSAQLGGEAATIEYAVDALGVTEIIVCGHSRCGAMAALLRPESLTTLPATRSWLRHAEVTRRIINDHYPGIEEDTLSLIAAQENILVQIEHLQTHPAVASRLVGGTLHLHGWLYRIETGEVFAYQPGGADGQGLFAPLSPQGTPLSQPATIKDRAPRDRAILGI